MYVANIIDFVVAQIYGGSDYIKSSETGGIKLALCLNYAVTVALVTTVYDTITDPTLSFFLFVGSAVQLVAFICLTLKVVGTKSVEGISSKTLSLYVIHLICRLVCTCIYQGYLPADSTGDYIYQLLDFFTLCIVIYLLYVIHKTYVHTYQDEHDSMKVRPMVTCSAVLAVFVHGGLNRSPLFDTLWAFSLNIEVCQMLPQVFMLAKVGGLVDKTTAHFVANIFLSCICRCIFWSWAIEGCDELSSEDGYTWNMPIAGWHIIIAHLLQLLILLDFMYYYVKWWRQGGTSVTLPQLSSESC